MKREYTRQGLHLVSTLALAFASMWLSQQWFILLVLGLIIGLIAFIRFRPASTLFLRVMERPHDRRRFPGKGAIMLLVGALVTAILFYAHILPALLVLGLADSFSTIIGVRFGTRRIAQTNKTWEGTATFFVLTATVLLFFSSWWLLIAALATAAEHINYHRYVFLDDNLIIPLLVASVLWLA